MILKDPPPPSHSSFEEKSLCFFWSIYLKDLKQYLNTMFTNLKVSQLQPSKPGPVA